MDMFQESGDELHKKMDRLPDTRGDISAGHLQLIGLGKIKAGFGERRGRVATVQTYVRFGDLGHAIDVGLLSEKEARSKCAMVASENCRQLPGDRKAGNAPLLGVSAQALNMEIGLLMTSGYGAPVVVPTEETDSQEKPVIRNPYAFDDLRAPVYGMLHGRAGQTEN